MSNEKEIQAPAQANACCGNWAAGTSCFADPQADCPRLLPICEAPAQADEGHVVVCWNHDRTRILAVTRQNTEGQILKVIAEAPAQAEVDLTPTEFCWLVEHFIGDGTGNSTGHYHTGFTDIGGNSRMTKDPYKAKRYATWKEANLAAMKLGHTLSGTWRAVQHGFAARIPEAPTHAAPLAGEVERGDVVAFEFYNRATGHAIVDYSVNTHVGNLSAAKGYEARPLVYAAPRQNVLDGSKLIPAWQAREALDELEAAARGDAPFNHQAAAVVRAALSHKEPQR